MKENKKEHEYEPDFDRYTYTAYFDGACTRKMKLRAVGVYSWIIFDHQGQEVAAQAGEVETQDAVTNNVSENTALLKLLEYVRDCKLEFASMKIVGDSELTMR